MKVYLKGFFGIFLGSLIGALPWILFEILGSTFLPILTVLIPIGGYTGFRVSKEEVGKFTALEIALLSIFLLALFSFLIFPFFTLFKDHFPITWSNLFLYYEDHDFLIEVIRNFLFTFFFTILGSGMVILLLKEDSPEENG